MPPRRASILATRTEIEAMRIQKALAARDPTVESSPLARRLEAHLPPPEKKKGAAVPHLTLPLATAGTTSRSDGHGGGGGDALEQPTHGGAEVVVPTTKMIHGFMFSCPPKMEATSWSSATSSVCQRRVPLTSPRSRLVGGRGRCGGGAAVGPAVDLGDPTATVPNLLTPRRQKLYQSQSSLYIPIRDRGPAMDRRGAQKHMKRPFNPGVVPSLGIGVGFGVQQQAASSTATPSGGVGGVGSVPLSKPPRPSTAGSAVPQPPAAHWSAGGGGGGVGEGEGSGEGSGEGGVGRAGVGRRRVASATSSRRPLSSSSTRSAGGSRRGLSSTPSPSVGGGGGCHIGGFEAVLPLHATRDKWSVQ